MKPTVSIIMPCYNAEAHLRQSIGSVQAQTVSDWELLVVDDGSKDGSWSVLADLAATDARIRPFRQQNAGAAAARNRSLREAAGEYAAFLDSDDTWHPDFLDVMLTALHGADGLAYCGWQHIGLEASRCAPFMPPDYENEGKTETLLQGCRWPIHAALVRTQAIFDVGCFDEGLSSCMDYDLWLRLGTTRPLRRVARVLSYYHHHGGDHITRNRARIALNHLRVQQKYIAAHPELLDTLGDARLREITLGELLKRGYESYWRRDLFAARIIFRELMKHRYGAPHDLKYMLPALLPELLHRALISLMDRRVDHAA